MLALRESGYALYVPFGENTRCDLLIEQDDCISRAQCKTGRLRKGAVVFAVCSCYGHHRNPEAARRSYQGQVDYFAVFCPETCAAYLVPIGDITARTTAALRIAPPRNGQRRLIRFASDYELAPATAGLRGLSGGRGSSA